MNKEEKTKLTQLDVSVSIVQEHIKNLDSKVSEGFASIERKLEKIDKRFDDGDEENEKKFAAKWVEQAMSALIGLIVVSVVATLLTLVVKKPLML